MIEFDEAYIYKDPDEGYESALSYGGGSNGSCWI
jgi:hypothetical protein